MLKDGDNQHEIRQRAPQSVYRNSKQVFIIMPFHEKQQKPTRFFAIFVEANESDV